MGVLRSFESADDLGIVELAARQGLSPSTTHRIVRALVDAGFLAQDERTERYRLGVALVELGLLTLRRLGVDAARPLLEELGRETGEAINLGIREGNDVLVVLRVPSAQPLRFEQPAGSRVPIHTSAMGKAILASTAPTTGRLDGLDHLERFTARTVTSKSVLRRELDEIRQRGYALNDEERNLGVRAVGAPVLDRQGRAIAAISVQGPTVRLTDVVVAAIAPLVRDTARRVADVLALQ